MRISKTHLKQRVTVNRAKMKRKKKEPLKRTLAKCRCVLTFLLTSAKSFSTHVMSHTFWRKNCTVRKHQLLYPPPTSCQDSSFHYDTRKRAGRLTTIASPLVSYFRPMRHKEERNHFDVWPFPRAPSWIHVCLAYVLKHFEKRPKL